MEAEAKWLLGIIGQWDTIAQSLERWPEIKKAAMNNAVPMDDDEPMGDVAVNIQPPSLQYLIAIAVSLDRDGLLSNATLQATTKNDLGRSLVELCNRRRNPISAELTSNSADGQLISAAVRAEEILTKALKRRKR